ncbi:uncharacterized protein LOC132329605 [Haemorhous mexicanus]|uniref:uncharacterized protein LOC132329605 n=1 Tax=Haemorhous mexicanus TaxID=30427 RepID=UPI0028BE72CC|nr:uncharacterized protein LOC132329605 [Haemorhous mexicanus]
MAEGAATRGLLRARIAGDEPVPRQRGLIPAALGCHQRRCKAVPEAELPKALPALLMPPKQDALCSSQRDSGCELEESESCSIHGVENEPLENRSATSNEHRRNLRRLLGQWFRSHPVVMALLNLLLPVLAFGVTMAVQSATSQVLVTPATPQCVLGCPHGWVWYKGVCYSFSRDYSTWEQCQERCSQLNASLAIAEDEEAMVPGLAQPKNPCHHSLHHYPVPRRLWLRRLAAPGVQSGQNGSEGEEAAGADLCQEWKSCQIHAGKEGRNSRWWKWTTIGIHLICLKCKT